MIHHLLVRSINKRLLVGLLLLSFFMIGMIVGYGSGISEGAESVNLAAVSANHWSAEALGVQPTPPGYLNPWSLVDLKTVPFPIAELAGCKNYQECSNFCDQAANEVACTSWFSQQ